MTEFFADAEASFNDARFVLYGYPFEGTTCFRKGAAKAPDEIRKHSYNFETYLMELGADLSDVAINDYGNLELKKDQDKNESMVTDLVSKIVNGGKFPIGLGGEHSLTPPAVKAVQAKYPNLIVVILDAHLDFRVEYEGNPRSHATVTRRVSELVGVDKVRPVGTRSVSRAEISEARAMGLKFIESGWTELREYLVDIVDDLDGPVYLSLPREVLAEELKSIAYNRQTRMKKAVERLPIPEAIQKAACALAAAQNPILVTRAVGKDPAAVALNYARLLVTCGLKQSKLTYGTPPTSARRKW